MRPARRPMAMEATQQKASAKAAIEDAIAREIERWDGLEGYDEWKARARDIARHATTNAIRALGVRGFMIVKGEKA